MGGDPIPETAQALQPVLRRIAGNDRGVNRADRNPRHPAELNQSSYQRTTGVAADLDPWGHPLCKPFALPVRFPVEDDQNLRDRKLPGRLRRHRDAGLFVDPNPGEKPVGAVLRTQDGASPFFSSNHADRPKETTSDVIAFRARVNIVSPSHECWLRMMPPDKYS